ncbi:MAG: RNA 2',3'-cyclic phosphodiesterase [Erysipelotrichaceae bacterium]|nr:RNA 2',3'-cyclic phosphodiesterase [Erysipelotrichaceae bacterium]
MRLFVAIDLSEEMRASLVTMMHDLKKADVKGSYQPVANLHLTLAFLGETEDVETVKEVLKSITYKPFRMAFGEKGNFGNTFWIGVKSNQGLNKLAKDVRTALAGRLPEEEREFVPHITLIRNCSGKTQGVKAARGEMMVKKVSLMKSEEKKGKRVYTEIFSF